MGGNVLITMGDINRIHKELLDASPQEFIEIIQPLLDQAAKHEQVCIVEKLIDSGMTVEELSFRLGRTEEDISEMYNLHVKQMNSNCLDKQFDYSYIKGCKLISSDK